MKGTTPHRALIMAVSLVLCLSMMVGTTIAWFTDTVTSENNIIQTGNLDVELQYQTKTESGWSDWNPVTETTNVFKENALWEPGYTEVVRLKVVNEGSLALKYELGAHIVTETASKNVYGTDFNLSDYIKCGFVDGNAEYTREEAVAAVQDNATVLSSTKVGENTAYLTGENGLEAGEDDLLTMVVYMPTTVGNEANHAKDAAAPEITLGLKVSATQLASESDSFDSTYDAEASIPGDDNVLNAGNVTVKIPDGAPNGNYMLKVTGDNTILASGTLSYDISLTRNGTPVKAEDGVMYPVEIDLGYVLDIRSLTHNGTPIKDYEYHPLVGILSFETNSFSPFAVEYIRMGEAVKIENKRLMAGLFKGAYDPVEIDETLKGSDSEYMSVSFNVNGEPHYSISKRDTTLFLAAPDTDVSAYENDYFNEITKFTTQNQLYKVLSDLQNNDHSTVYLLPGTYNEGTAINVYSSMDIIGLGAAEDIQIIKVKGSYSNRHLFNINGAVTREEHIQVTLRNLYLDANAKNLNSAGKLYMTDNAAVQSIRLSKVKCYDLIISKNSGFPFYVNGKYDTRGAYMYVENTTTTGSSVVDTAAPYKFYYNNIFTKGSQPHTTTNTYQKNQPMQLDDWSWN